MAVLALVWGVGCAPQGAVPLGPADPVSEVAHPIASTNFTPFQSIIGAGLTGDGKSFIGAAIKVTLDEAKDAESVLVSPQAPFIGPESVIDELAPFRSRGEVYLITSGEPPSSGEILIHSTTLPLNQAEWVKRDRTFGFIGLAPFLEANDIVTVITPTTSLTFALPALFSPYVLARYHTGAIVPTPMRGDTLIIDLDSRQLAVVYRSTLPSEPPLRALEFRLISEPTEPWPSHTLASTRARFAAQQRYLATCPVPRAPIEECAQPHRRPAREFLDPLQQ